MNEKLKFYMKLRICVGNAFLSLIFFYYYLKKENGLSSSTKTLYKVEM